jgi:hypothetical protein
MSSGRNQVSIEVLAFDGNHISVSLKISLEGNYSDKLMWVQNSPAHSSSSSRGDISDTIFVEIWRGMSRSFDENSNSTVFSYKYSSNNTYFKSEQKLFRLLLLPKDSYSLTFRVAANFNLTIDDLNCVLPSQNYEGIINKYPTSDPTIYRIELVIRHPADFELVYSLMLFSVLASLYGISVTMSVLLFRRGREDIGGDVIRVSPAMMFFIPAFEIALNALKSPLSLVFSDVLSIPIIPWNAAIIGYALFIKHKTMRRTEEPENS